MILCIMKEIVLITICLCITYSAALECEVGRTNTDTFKQALTLCIKNNETLERIWDMTSGSSSSESKSLSSESTDETQTENPRLNMDLKTSRPSRIRRSGYRGHNNDQQINGRRSSGENRNNTEENEDTNSTDDNHSGSNDGPNCMVHCVFEHLDMTDDDGFPEHTKFVQGLLKTTSNRELRDFLQDSADDCFQQMEKEEDAKDPCVYTSKLVTCLAEKGKRNCADWPAGNLPF